MVVSDHFPILQIALQCLGGQLAVVTCRWSVGCSLKGSALSQCSVIHSTCSALKGLIEESNAWEHIYPLHTCNPPSRVCLDCCLGSTLRAHGWRAPSHCALLHVGIFGIFNSLHSLLYIIICTILLHFPLCCSIYSYIVPSKIFIEVDYADSHMSPTRKVVLQGTLSSELQIQSPLHDHCCWWA